jgi:hypothetical protein
MFSAFGRKTATIPAQGNMAVILKGGALFFCQKNRHYSTSAKYGGNP